MPKLTFVYNEGSSYINFNTFEEMERWVAKKWPGSIVLPTNYNPIRGPYEAWLGNQKLGETEHNGTN